MPSRVASMMLPVNQIGTKPQCDLSPSTPSNHHVHPRSASGAVRRQRDSPCLPSLSPHNLILVSAAGRPSQRFDTRSIDDPPVAQGSIATPARRSRQRWLSITYSRGRLVGGALCSRRVPLARPRDRRDGRWETLHPAATCDASGGYVLPAQPFSPTNTSW